MVAPQCPIAVSSEYTVNLQTVLKSECLIERCLQHRLEKVSKFPHNIPLIVDIH